MDAPERTVLGRGRRGHWQSGGGQEETGREIILKASGTPSESLLRSLSGVQNRHLRVHLCGDPCAALVWEEGYLHCSQLQEVDREGIGWSQNLEAAVEKEDDDELKQLRTSAEELRLRGKGVGGQVEKETKKRKRRRNERRWLPASKPRRAWTVYSVPPG